MYEWLSVCMAREKITLSISTKFVKKHQLGHYYKCIQTHAYRVDREAAGVNFDRRGTKQ